MTTLEALRDGPATCSVEAAARALGLSRSAAYRAIAAGELPSVRIGKRLRVPTAALVAMLEAS